MQLSGPVFATKAILDGRTFYLFSDRHNSVTGSCGGSCSDISFDGTPTDGNDKCKTITRCIHDFVGEGGDVYLEAPYVAKDSVKPRTLSEDTDYIDRIVYIFHEDLLRHKREIRDRGQMHYTDIRERFEGMYSADGTRTMLSANPFSGSVATRYLSTVGTSGFQEARSFLRFVLDNAWTIFEHYCGKGPMVLPSQKGTIFDEYRERILRMPESHFRGQKMSRVAKQLRKLSPSLASSIENWARSRFTQELAMGENVFSTFSQSMPLEQMRVVPISCLVSLSSIIMDIYTLARCFYQSKGDVLFYCGAAHIENYIGFFREIGARIEEPSLPTRERCLLFKM